MFRHRSMPSSCSGHNKTIYPIKRPVPWSWSYARPLKSLFPFNAFWLSTFNVFGHPYYSFDEASCARVRSQQISQLVASKAQDYDTVSVTTQTPRQWSGGVPRRQLRTSYRQGRWQRGKGFSQGPARWSFFNVSDQQTSLTRHVRAFPCNQRIVASD